MEATPSLISSGNRYVKSEIFWGEIAPCEHLVNFYDTYDEFLEHLTLFVTGGFRLGETVVLLATPEHLEALDERLSKRGFDINAFRASGQFMTFDAQATLDSFMVDGWPEEELFIKTITSVLAVANMRGTRVRAFGEMVVLLWANGLSGATVRLEHLWHQLCNSQKLPLFCAYPRSGFTTTPLEAIEQISSAHSKIVRTNVAN